MGRHVYGFVAVGVRATDVLLATDEGCFWATDEHGFSRMNRRGSWVFSAFYFL